MSQNDIDIEEPIKQASPEVQKIVREVLQVEKENRNSERPQVSKDILDIIKAAVK